MLREMPSTVKYGSTVLNTRLRWLRLERDPSLAFRYSCLNANSCKECMLLLDGSTRIGKDQFQALRFLWS